MKYKVLKGYTDKNTREFHAAGSEVEYTDKDRANELLGKMMIKEEKVPVKTKEEKETVKTKKDK